MSTETILTFGVRNLKTETTNEWFSLQWSEGSGSDNSIMLCVWMEREKQRQREEWIKYPKGRNLLQYLNSRTKFLLWEKKKTIKKSIRNWHHLELCHLKGAEMMKWFWIYHVQIRVRRLEDKNFCIYFLLFLVPKQGMFIY